MARNRSLLTGLEGRWCLTFRIRRAHLLTRRRGAGQRAKVDKTRGRGEVSPDREREGKRRARARRAAWRSRNGHVSALCEQSKAEDGFGSAHSLGSNSGALGGGCDPIRKLVAAWRPVAQRPCCHSFPPVCALAPSLALLSPSHAHYSASGQYWRIAPGQGCFWHWSHGCGGFPTARRYGPYSAGDIVNLETHWRVSLSTTRRQPLRLAAVILPCSSSSSLLSRRLLSLLLLLPWARLSPHPRLATWAACPTTLCHICRRKWRLTTFRLNLVRNRTHRTDWVALVWVSGPWQMTIALLRIVPRRQITGVTLPTSILTLLTALPARSTAPSASTTARRSRWSPARSAAAFSSGPAISSCNL
ncbi:hypothetical protein MRB53_038394 [Persea americana]|nr:hypothetical protein MRB53_038394 [Persea americana]